MIDADYFFGSLEHAPAAVQQAAGSLIPVADSAQVIAVYVPAGVQVMQEDIVRVGEGASHLVMVLEAGAEVQMALWLEGPVTDHAAEIVLAEEARCTLLTVNAAAGAMRASQRSVAERGAAIKWQNVTVGSGIVEHELVSRLTGDDAVSDVEWMCYAKGSERQTLNVRNVFDARNGGGEILMRGIAEEKGHTVCRGLIEIGLQGGGTNTYLTQEVLMLDATAKVDAIPGLEIKTNDVKASHSATVARVTEEDLFYFGARGIDPHEARRMFVVGFLGDIAGRIIDERARSAVIAAVEEKYGR